MIEDMPAAAFCDPQFNSSLPSALHFYSAPNTPQRRLFDILTKAFKVSFPAVDIRPQESMETALSLENKSSFLLFFFFLYDGRRGALICRQSTLRALVVQQRKGI